MTEGRKKYLYEHLCDSCGTLRRIQCKNPKGNKCSSCAGKQAYVPATSPRNDARKKGDGYVTKQGYHLVFHEGKYQPAHTLVVEVRPGQVVHHVDGNKLHNLGPNLYACSKGRHREVHHQLERLSYFLIQQGLTEFKDGEYTFSDEMKEFLHTRGVIEPGPGAVDIQGTQVPPTLTGRVK